ncbi:unnamed protein product [Durusdinium trenchii]|uniref:Uncharacterized protein n=1 Tax=Durusdinium trenchii TaxID=1381693 RepID=A0ABP0PPG0_9DINO
MVLVVVKSLTGETLLEEELTAINAQEILQKLKASCFDRLLMGSTTVDREMPIPEASSTVDLTLVRVDLGLLAGLSEEMMQTLHDFGSIQDAPGALSSTGRCLSIAKADSQSFSGGGFGGNSTLHHLLLLPDGRILAKYHHESDYMEHCGDYDCSCCWEIAEGRFEPIVDAPGEIQVTWSGWAELRHHSSEPFGPGTITKDWEAKVIDEKVRRGPAVLVPTERGRLSIPKLCEIWAKEGSGGVGCARSKSLRVSKSEAMPKLNEETLKTLEMDPANLSFWELV